LPARPTKDAWYPISVRQVAVLLRTAFRRHLAMTDLQNKGVRCWLAPHDMRIGAKMAPTLPLRQRVRAPAREMARKIKDRGRPTRSIGARAVGKVVNDDRADWREACSCGRSSNSMRHSAAVYRNAQMKSAAYKCLILQRLRENRKIVIVNHVTDKEKTDFVALPSTMYVLRYFDGERLPWPHLLQRDYEKAPARRIIFWNIRQLFKDTKAPGHTLHQSCRLPVARPSTSKVCAAPIVSASA
jgi:hypothetical protein